MATKFFCPSCGFCLSEPYIKCVECVNPPLSFCVHCFSKGRIYGNHQNDHKYSVVRNNFSLFDPMWIASEEKLLLEAIEVHGIGNWVDIAASVGSKSQLECSSHYYNHYVYNAKPPLPILEEHRIISKGYPTPIPFKESKDPPHPVFGNSMYNDMSGYMAARGDFGAEYNDYLEMNVCNMDFSLDLDPSCLELQKTVLRIFQYNLKKRARIKCIIKRYGLISSQKNFEEWKRYHCLGKKVVDNMKTLMRLMKPDKFDEFMEGALCAEELKQRVRILQECRKAGVTRLHNINTYIRFKQTQEQRFRHKTILDEVLAHMKDDASKHLFISKQVLKETSQGMTPANSSRRSAPPLSVIGLPGYEKLSEKERDLCSILRIYPNAYLQYKGTLVNEYRKLGYLRLANARSIIKIDVNKTRKIYDLLLEEGVVTKDSAPV